MTPFTKVYDVFMKQLKTDDLVLQFEEDPMIIQDKLQDMLFTSADIHFKECIKKLSQRDDEAFKYELTDEEVRILALGMKLEYISTVILPNESAVRNAFYTKDYVHFSPNQKVKNLSEMENKVRDNLRISIRRYQYYNMLRGG